ncbi:MAG: PQQ-binding-like beta-propeller repeat protein [Sphingomonadales bacterium]
MMKLIQTQALLVFACLTVASCTFDGEPSDKMATEADDNDNIDEATRVAGKAVFDENCAGCHLEGVDKAPHWVMLSIMAPESIYHALTDGVMSLQSEHISDGDKMLVAEYLSSRKMGTAASVDTLPVCEGTAAAFDLSSPPLLSGYGLTEGNRHYLSSEIAGIDAESVTNLELKWSLAFPNAVRARSQPAFGGGAIFVGSHSGVVYALDQETGCARWTFQASAEVRTGIVLSSWEADDVTASPMLFFGDLIGNFYAVNAFTGQQVWRKKMDAHPNATITAAPALHHDILYVPISSLEVAAAAIPSYECCTFRGSIVALKADTGDEVWRTYTVSEEPAIQRVNTNGTNNYGPSGAPVWNTPTVDAARRQLYFGTGENYTDPATKTSDSVIALDMDTGAINWVYQATLNDTWNVSCESADKSNCPEVAGPDSDFGGAGAILAQDANGNDHVLAGQKSGFAYALDPDTGALRWKAKVGRGGVRAGIHFGLAAQAGIVYVPISDSPDGHSHDTPARPGMYALNIATGDYAWSAPAKNICNGKDFCEPGYCGAITTTDSLVFAGAMDGYVRAYDTANGHVVWEYDTDKDYDAINGLTAMGGSICGGAAPVAYKGNLVVNSGYGFSGTMPGNALLVFGPAETRPIQ